MSERNIVEELRAGLEIAREILQEGLQPVFDKLAELPPVLSDWLEQIEDRLGMTWEEFNNLPESEQQALLEQKRRQ